MGERILIDKSQFFSEDQKRPVTLYKIQKSVPSESGRNKKEKLFETASQIQVVLFLRDYWFAMNGKEIPLANEMWNETKQLKGIVFNQRMEDNENGSNKENND